MFCTIDDIKAGIKAYSNFFKKHQLPDDDELSLIGESVADEITGVLYLHNYDVDNLDPKLQKFVSALNVHGVIAELIAKIVPADSRADNVAERRFEQGINILAGRRTINLDKSATFERDNPQW